MASNYKNSKKQSSKLRPELKEAKDWIEQIKLAEKVKGEFNARAEKAYKDYTLEEQSNVDGEKLHCYAIHHANVKTIGPNIYYAFQQPRVTREDKNRTNPDHILASDILEKNITKTVREQPFDYRIKRVRDQWLNAGLGQVWVRYKYTTDQDGEEGENDIALEIAEIEVVDWDDYLVNASNNFDQVLWQGRALYYTKDEFRECFPKFPESEIDNLSFGTLKKTERKGRNEEDPFARTKVWEIWDSQSKKIVFIADNYADRIVEVRDPVVPHKDGKKVLFKNFFPCPRPLLATVGTENFWPVCDHHFIAKEAKTLSLISSRTKDIADKGLMVKGLYEQSFAKKFNQVLEGVNGDYFGADLPDMSKGLDALVWNWPTDKYAQVVEQCLAVADVQKNTIYELTGMSDILRGQGDPDSTATAEQLKAENASMRLEEKRLEFKRFLVEIYDKISEVICEGFHWRTILQNAGIDTQFFVDQEGEQARLYPVISQELVSYAQLEQQQQQPGVATQTLQSYQSVLRALQLLRDERLRHFAIDVEIESMLKRDQVREKQETVEFLQAFGGVANQFKDLIAGIPEITPVFADVVMELVRKYDTARHLEQRIEESLNQFVQARMQPKEQAPDYNMIKLQIEQQKLQLEAQEQARKGQEAAGKQQIEQMKLQLESQQQQLEHAVDVFLAKIKEFEAQVKAQEAGVNAQVKQADLALKGQKQQLDASIAVDRGYREGQHGEVDAALRAQEAALRAVESEQNAQFKSIELAQKQFALEQEAKEPGNQYSDGG